MTALSKHAVKKKEEEESLLACDFLGGSCGPLLLQHTRGLPLHLGLVYLLALLFGGGGAQALLCLAQLGDDLVIFDLLILHRQSPRQSHDSKGTGAW